MSQDASILHLWRGYIAFTEIQRSINKGTSNQDNQESYSHNKPNQQLKKQSSYLTCIRFSSYHSRCQAATKPSQLLGFNAIPLYLTLLNPITSGTNTNSHQTLFYHTHLPPTRTPLTNTNLHQLGTVQNLPIYLSNPRRFERVTLGIPTHDSRKGGAEMVQDWEKRWELASSSNGSAGSQ